jgi:rod shape-determining protein MreD
MILRAPLPPLTAPRPEEILLPVKPWFIVLTLVLALLANTLPFGGVVQSVRPDFLALVLLFWCIAQPRFVGVGTAWALGLVMDVADANLFGQHALAYALLAFAAEFFHRRVLRFSLWAQAVHVAALLVLCQGVVLLVRIFAGASGVSWVYFVPSLSAALLWPATSIMLQWPQRPPSPTEL